MRTKVGFSGASEFVGVLLVLFPEMKNEEQPVEAGDFAVLLAGVARSEMRPSMKVTISRFAVVSEKGLTLHFLD